jgi:hypothetical protein
MFTLELWLSSSGQCPEIVYVVRKMIFAVQDFYAIKQAPFCVLYTSF